MIFNSAHFLIFFQIVVAAYFSIPNRWRGTLLLLSSCYFYMVFIPKYILILFALILIDYLAGIAIEDSGTASRRKLLLVISLVANIGMLGFFKYFNFANDNLAALLSWLHLGYRVPDLGIVLPIGLSFHTFQSMSYTIEVYRGTQKAERNLQVYAAYVLFFPQLVAGPIERPRLLAQFHQDHEFEYVRVADGLKLMLWGLFKKAVVADRLAVLVNHVFSRPGAHNGAEFALATYFFSFQIYCDFSGYSDMALGAAQILGFHLVQNFNRPYFSKSIAEFWKRWHISLSTWFRDYLYIPLGGNRVAPWRWYFNILVVFLVSGLWHGANWTFLLWGAIHGAYLIGSIWTEGLRARWVRLIRLDSLPRLHRFIQVAITFHLATLAWIAFRARSVSETLLIINRILDFGTWRRPVDLGIGGRDLVIALAAVALMESVHLFQRGRRLRESLSATSAWLRWPAYAAAVLIVLCFGRFNSQSFIYFQF